MSRIGISVEDSLYESSIVRNDSDPCDSQVSADDGHSSPRSLRVRSLLTCYLLARNARAT